MSHAVRELWVFEDAAREWKVFVPCNIVQALAEIGEYWEMITEKELEEVYLESRRVNALLDCCNNWLEKRPKLDDTLDGLRAALTKIDKNLSKYSLAANRTTTSGR